MGSVIDYQDCKRCGNVAYVDYYYKTGEEYFSCSSCGKSYKDSIKRDKDHKVVKDKDGNPVWVHKENAGFGAACIAGERVFTILAAPKEGYNEWFQIVLDKINTEDGVVKEKSYITKWDEDQGKLIALYGKLPEY